MIANANGNVNVSKKNLFEDVVGALHKSLKTGNNLQTTYSNIFSEKN